MKPTPFPSSSSPRAAAAPPRTCAFPMPEGSAGNTPQTTPKSSEERPVCRRTPPPRRRCEIVIKTSTNQQREAAGVTYPPVFWGICRTYGAFVVFGRRVSIMISHLRRFRWIFGWLLENTSPYGAVSLRSTEPLAPSQLVVVLPPQQQKPH